MREVRVGALRARGHSRLHRYAALHPLPLGDEAARERPVRTAARMARRKPVISSSISPYRVLWPCHTRLTPKYRALVSEARQHKRVHHLKSPAEIGAFLDSARLEARIN